MSLATGEENLVEQEFEAVALELLTEVTKELFETYEHAVERVDTSDAEAAGKDLTLGAAIGFTGEYVRGVLVIALDEEMARCLNPVSKTNPHTDYDWIGELANQLLGRLKNKLLSYSIEVALSTPVVVHGSQLSIGTLQRTSTRLCFRHQNLFANVWWDAEVDPALEMSTENAPDVQAEGEMVLF